MGAAAKLAGTIVTGALLLILTCTAGLASVFGALSSSGLAALALPSRHALTDIPQRMLALYQQAAPTCPGLPWSVLAAIGKIETDHARSPTMISSTGAVGPMQFLPTTFTAYAYPVPPGGKNPPTPWDPVDAVHTAARLLCANGARNGKDLRAALFAYNHSTTYVNHVLDVADSYAAPAPAPTGAAATAVAFARAQLGTPYVWGGDGPADGGFDCSGLTRAAYSTASIPLPRTAQAQYDTGPHIPTGQPLLPGDLLFYGPSPHNITHVSIYAGDNRMINAPRPGQVVREEGYRYPGDHYQGATRPAARLGTRPDGR